MKRFFLTFLSFLPLMAFGFTRHYDDVTIDCTMRLGSYIELNPYKDIGFEWGFTRYEYGALSCEDFILGGVFWAYHDVSDEGAFEIDAEMVSSMIDDARYYIYTLKALKRGVYTFTGYVRYINEVESADVGGWMVGASTAHATYRIFVDVVKVGDLWYALDREANTAEVTCCYDEDGYEFEELEIPSSITHNGITYRVTGIDDEAFAYCGGLTSINIPNSVTSIGKEAFEFCSELTSIDIPNGVTEIGDYAFNSCYELADINIPNSVTRIGEGAFAACECLEEIDIPSSVTSIGVGAFMACSSLTSVAIPEGVTSIEAQTFEYCYNLTEVIIPNSVTSIGLLAFHVCLSLPSITIPASVNSIGIEAFSCCFSLEEIYCYAEETPEVSDDSFNDVEVGDVTLYVPRNSYNQYKEHPVWGKFDIAVGTDIKQVGEAQSTMYNKIYNLEGRKLPAPQHGMNIIRHSDGTTRKVLQR